MKRKKYKTATQKLLFSKLTALKSRCKNGRKKAVDKGPEIEFDLTLDWLLEQYTLQDGKCFFTGTKLELKPVGDGKPAWNSLSFDRYNSNAGYVQGNVVLSIHIINMIRGWMPHPLRSKVFDKILNKEFIKQENKFKKQIEQKKKVISP